MRNTIVLIPSFFVLLVPCIADAGTGTLGLSHETLAFAAESNTNGFVSRDQTVFVSSVFAENAAWTVQEEVPWLTVSTGIGFGSGSFTVSVFPAGLDEGFYSGMIEVNAPLVWDLPRSITVTLDMVAPGSLEPPSGEFSTPGNDSVVFNSIAVSGWALDDVGIDSIRIYRDPVDGEGSSLIYIGDADQVKGARPDIAAAFPDYPENDKAGWGYMLLTNALPNGGNGVFTLHVKVTDVEGNEVLLGSHTIIVDNASSVAPFGTLDTPTPGGVASGDQFVVYGWALTPQPSVIPEDGSTIQVFVDGVFVGPVIYNQYRADIAGQFPGYANSGGAVGYAILDTTAYDNGQHVIQWTVTDSAGNTSGIGSRYFTIQNDGKGNSSSGFNVDVPYAGKSAEAQRESGSTFDFSGLDVVELDVSELFDQADGTFHCVVTRGDLIDRMPVGSTFDPESGIHYWQPGPAADGAIGMRYFQETPDGEVTSVDVHHVVAPVVRPTGACCLPDGCEELGEVHCEVEGGVFAGPDTGCDSPDCNSNGVPDVCDIASGTSLDCDGNGIPDECELCGDLDDDSDVDYDDYVIFRDAFGGVVDGNPPEDACCDYDGTGAVGMMDYVQWLTCYRDFVGNPKASPPRRPSSIEHWNTSATNNVEQAEVQQAEIRSFRKR